MSYDELTQRLNNYGLRLCIHPEGKYAIVSPHFANPLLWIDANIENKDYNGSITVKSINASLFTAEQIRMAIMLADSFLDTPINERGAII